MAMRICNLGSGSSGNATYIRTPEGSLLVDAGLSARKTVQRLEEIDVDPKSIDAVVITHEHRDHTGGLPILHKRFQLPVYANSGTREALTSHDKFNDIDWKIFSNNSGFYINGIFIEAFSIPHDAYDPVGFIIRYKETSVGVATDMGVATNIIRQRLKNCDALVVESNYDDDMLADAPRPLSLKQRIMGRQGHLSNAHAVDMLVEVASPRLKQVFLAHLSGECNCRDLARATVATRLKDAGHGHVKIDVTYQDQVSPVWEQGMATEMVISEVDGQQGFVFS